MTRTQRWLAIALGVQLLLIFWLRSPFSATPTSTAQRDLLPGIEQLEPTRIELYGEENQQLTLTRGAAGWELDQPPGFPAEASKVDTLLESLQLLTARQPVVSSRRYHDTFKVDEDDPVGRIKIFADELESPEIDLLLGSSTNYRVTHMREARQDEVYEVAGFAPHEARPDPTIWMDKQLLRVDPAELTELKLDWKEHSFRLYRDAGIWLLSNLNAEDTAGQPTDPAKVGELLRAASSLRMTEAIGPRDDVAHGFNSAEIRMQLTTTDGAIHELVIGAPIDDNEQKRHVGRSGFGFTGAIWLTDLDKFKPDAIRGVESVAAPDGTGSEPEPAG